MIVKVSTPQSQMNPQAPTSESDQPSSGGPAGNSLHRRGRILHVDDDPMARMVFSGWMKHHNYDHHQAASPAEADALLAKTTVDIVISDIHMPGNCRLEWVEQLLARENPPAIILLTGKPELETACRAANLPVAGYLLKPPQLSTLDATLQHILQGQRRRTDFLTLSHDILRLLGTQGTEDLTEQTTLVNKLAQLAQCFNARNLDPGDDGSPNDVRWREALGDTIAVIEKTKHSFHSRELGQLRIRLQHLLTGM